MTVSDLIDYLQQFRGDTTVLLSESEQEKLPEETRYIVLDRLDYSPDDGEDE